LSRRFPATCLATSAQMHREVMRMESSLSFHNTRMRLIFANSSRTKFKSGMQSALAMSRIAVKHTKRAPLRTSSPGLTAPASSVQLRKRTKSGRLRTIIPDLIGGMRSMTLFLGILAANVRSLFLSPSESCLNSQVIVLRSSSSAGFVASFMTLFGKSSVRCFRCSSTAFSSEYSTNPGIGIVSLTQHTSCPSCPSCPNQAEPGRCMDTDIGMSTQDVASQIEEVRNTQRK
jgi:hypothetical protein